jgi:hypothetical protein
MVGRRCKVLLIKNFILRKMCACLQHLKALIKPQCVTEESPRGLCSCPLPPIAPLYPPLSQVRRQHSQGREGDSGHAHQEQR